MVINRGDTHDLLVMTIKISNDKKVEIIMKHHIEETVSQFKDICNKKVTSPCAQHLWDVIYEAELLYDIKSDFFTC